jgi:hypothetical protein
MLYQVWLSMGHGLQPGPRFRLLDDAIRYTSNNSRQASFAVRGPGGEWVHIQPRDIVDRPRVNQI